MSRVASPPLDLARAVQAVQHLRGLGWTRAQIARAVGVDRRSLYAWSAGRAQPTTAHLAALQRLAESAQEPLWAPAARALADGRLAPLERRGTVRPERTGEMDDVAGPPADLTEAVQAAEQALRQVQPQGHWPDVARTAVEAAWPVLASRAKGDAAACCDLHGPACEPPSELCCQDCTETMHPSHEDGSACVLPDGWDAASLRAELDETRRRLDQADRNCEQACADRDRARKEAGRLLQALRLADSAVAGLLREPVSPAGAEQRRRDAQRDLALIREAIRPYDDAEDGEDGG